MSGGAVGVDGSTPCSHNKRNRWIFSSSRRHQWRLCEAFTEAKGLRAQFCFFPVFPSCQPVSMLVIKQRASLFPPETPLVKLTDFLLQFFVLSISEDVCLKRKRRSSRSFRSVSGWRRASDRVISFTQHVCLASIHMSFMLPTHQLKQPQAPTKAFCLLFQARHGNAVPPSKHPRHRTKREADRPPSGTHPDPASPG